MQAALKPRSFNNPDSKYYSAAQQQREMKEMAPLMPDRLSDPLLDIGVPPLGAWHACKCTWRCMHATLLSGA
jgi:hypothetical protein